MSFPKSELLSDDPFPTVALWLSEYKHQNNEAKLKSLCAGSDIQEFRETSDYCYLIAQFPNVSSSESFKAKYDGKCMYTGVNKINIGFVGRKEEPHSVTREPSPRFYVQKSRDSPSSSLERVSRSPERKNKGAPAATQSKQVVENTQVETVNVKPKSARAPTPPASTEDDRDEVVIKGRQLEEEQKGNRSPKKAGISQSSSKSKSRSPSSSSFSKSKSDRSRSRRRTRSPPANRARERSRDRAPVRRPRSGDRRPRSPQHFGDRRGYNNPRGMSRGPPGRGSRDRRPGFGNAPRIPSHLLRDGGGSRGQFGPVIKVENIHSSAQSIHLFNLFGVFGDVLRIKFTFKEEGAALIEYRRAISAEIAYQNANGIPLFGRPVRVMRTAMPEVMRVPEEGDFRDHPMHRFTDGFERKMLNIHAPTTSLFVSNLYSNADEDEIRANLTEAFSPYAKIYEIVFVLLPDKGSSRMAILDMSSVEDVVQSLIHLHGKSIPGLSSNIRLNFTNRTCAAESERMRKRIGGQD